MPQHTRYASPRQVRPEHHTRHEPEHEEHKVPDGALGLARHREGHHGPPPTRPPTNSAATSVRVIHHPVKSGHSPPPATNPSTKNTKSRMARLDWPDIGKAITGHPQRDNPR